MDRPASSVRVMDPEGLDSGQEELEHSTVSCSCPALPCPRAPAPLTWLARPLHDEKAAGPDTRYGNGYPKSETRWIFILLGYGFGSIFIPMSSLMDINVYPTGS
jgi:hypothetical protein